MNSTESIKKAALLAKEIIDTHEMGLFKAFQAQEDKTLRVPLSVSFVENANGSIDVKVDISYAVSKKVKDRVETTVEENQTVLPGIKAPASKLQEARYPE